MWVQNSHYYIHARNYAQMEPHRLIYYKFTAESAGKETEEIGQ